MKLREIKKSLHYWLIDNFGIDIVKVDNQKSLLNTNQSTTTQKNYYYESDNYFLMLHKNAIEASESPHNPDIIPQRLYNTVQFFIQTLNLEGEIAECGCFKGRSSYVFCHYAKHILSEFSGKSYHIFDSFEGISQPRVEDKIDSSDYGQVGEAFLDSGAFKASMEHVKKSLSDFPDIQYHQGWIPDSFQDQPERSYKFVHLDLDLYEPIKASINYFYPRLVSGGIIVIDEYGFPRWPGAKKAVDECCDHFSIPVIGLTTGNGVLIKI